MTILLWLFYLFHIINGISIVNKPPDSTYPDIPNTLVDILSSQPQFSYFLRHLQRHGLIPQLNLMKNVTLLAPINSAFVNKNNDDEWNNNQLLRYIVNQKFRVGYLNDQDAIFETLYKIDKKTYYPIKISPDFESKEYVIDNIASIVDEDIYAKHQHSFVQGIDHLLPLKPTICQVLINSTIPEISIMSSIFQSIFENGEDCETFSKGYQSFILPTNNLIKSSLTNIELAYYLLNFNTIRGATKGTTEEATKEVNNDIKDLLENLMFSEFIFGVNNTNSKAKAKSGLKQEFKFKKNKLEVGSLETDNSHVLSNGAIHIFDEGESFFKTLKVPTVDMVARKALYALNYSNFVKELQFRSLDYLIDGSVKKQSIILGIDQRDDTNEEVNLLSFSSKQNLLYQFVNEEIKIKDDLHILVDSKLCSNKKIGGCYKIKISSSAENGDTKTTINDEVDVIESIPIANSSVIYIGNEEITPPVNLKHSLGDLISSGTIPRHLENVEIDRTSCLRTLGYLNTFNLYSLDDNEAGYSIFLPCGAKTTQINKKTSLWDDLGLVLDYLESNPKLFKKIIQGLFLNGVVYSNFKGNKKLKSLNGQKVQVSGEQKNDTNFISLNKTIVEIASNSDILFNQGIVHVLDKILLPDDFQLPIEDLIKTTFDTKFPGFSIDNLLKFYPKIKKSLTGNHPFSLLVPTPESLKDFNITSSFHDLIKFIDFHLIPNDEVSKILDCINGVNQDSIIKTNLSQGGLTCRHKNDKVMLKLYKLNETETNIESYNKDQEVRVLKHGCTSEYKGSTKDISCIFLLEKPMNLKWFEKTHTGDNFLHIHLGLVSVGIGVILGLIMFGGVMVGFVYCTSRKKTYNLDSEHYFPRSDSGYMSVLTDDDEYLPYDRGYETDTDVLRSETDGLLLPSNLKRKKRIKKIDYGSIINNENDDNRFTVLPKATLPRNIGNLKETLNRDRNIPGCSQF
ncbi:unnamed protein product [Candida verbasci]|uniref:FAS1 domain-containing protein n=1 Tax=Candida verbasci TaxID=1227364 RepID=A0A9W4U1Q5_9ASCO|nr:unnamed protein product [Candida verbasci]